MDPLAARLLLVVALLALVTALGRWAQSRDGRVTTADPAATPDVPRMTAVERNALGLPGDGPGAVLFGSPTCAPCDTVKGMLRDVEGDQPGFRWSYVDAAEHLDVATTHRVRRVPTLLVVGADGAVTARTSGVPDRDELRRAVGELAVA